MTKTIEEPWRDLSYTWDAQRYGYSERRTVWMQENGSWWCRLEWKMEDGAVLVNPWFEQGPTDESRNPRVAANPS
jgi:hypothetical protein